MYSFEIIGILVSTDVPGQAELIPVMVGSTTYCRTTGNLMTIGPYSERDATLN